jgi:hypothetical protein
VPVIVAVIGLLVAFGVDVTDEQQDAIVAAVVAVCIAVPVVAGLIRRLVTPSANVVVQLDKGGEVTAGEASTLPTGLILEPGATVEDVTP